jgi:protein phosphatase
MSISAKRPTVEPHPAEAELLPDDILVLCTDGLWGVIPETLIWAAANELAPQAAADKLVALANSSQGPDNISVIIARRYQPDRKPAAADMDETNP